MRSLAFRLPLGFVLLAAAATAAPAQELPAPSALAGAGRLALVDSLPPPALSPAPALPPPTLGPAVLTGAIVGALAEEVDPECAPASSRLQSAAIGALWGGLRHLLGGGRREAAARPADHPAQDETILEAFCDEPESRLR